MPTDSPLLLEKAGSADRASLQDLLDAIEQAELTTTDARDAASTSESNAAESANAAQEAAGNAFDYASDAADSAESAQRAEDIVDEVNALAPLSRTLVVDARYEGNEANVAFGTLSEAVLYARGVVDTDGGTVLIRVHNDESGTPISVDLRDHDITPDPLDEYIRIVSPIFEAQKNRLMLYGEANHANLAGTIRHDDLAITIHTSSS